MTSGEQIQNQVFFDGVRVPKANVLGDIDDGWTVAKYLLEFERGGGAVLARTAGDGRRDRHGGRRRSLALRRPAAR